MRVSFLVGGTEPAGTNQLFALLQEHPRICLPVAMQPEPNFFSKRIEYDRGAEYYHQRFFGHACGQSIVGEKSGRYLWHELAAERIQAYNRDMKLIFLLRDPVDRAYSNYRFNCLNGLETLRFEDALAAEGERCASMSGDPRWSDIQPFAYFDKGLYARQLRRYFERFDRRQILLLDNRELRSRPAAVRGEVLRFIGLPDDLNPPPSCPEFRSFGVRSRRLQRWLRRWAPDLLERAVMKRRSQQPCGLLERLVQLNFADRAGCPPQHAVADLRRRYAADMADLARLTGRNWFPWTAPGAKDLRNPVGERVEDQFQGCNNGLGRASSGPLCPEPAAS